MMMAGRMHEDPFTMAHKEAGTVFLRSWVKEQGFPEIQTPDDIPQGPPFVARFPSHLREP